MTTVDYRKQINGLSRGFSMIDCFQRAKIVSVQVQNSQEKAAKNEFPGFLRETEFDKCP